MRWSETDVLGFVESGGFGADVLIEDGIASQFTECQAAGNRERAADPPAGGDADRSLAVLCAPPRHLDEVSADDPWDWRTSLPTPFHIQIVWKKCYGQASLTFSGYEVCKVSGIAVPEGVNSARLVDSR